MYPTKDKSIGVFEKKVKGWRFDFRGPNLFWQRCVDCIMSSPNADLIAVSLVYSKDLKSPYRMGPPELVVSEPFWRK